MGFAHSALFLVANHLIPDVYDNFPKAWEWHEHNAAPREMTIVAGVARKGFAYGFKISRFASLASEHQQCLADAYRATELTPPDRVISSTVYAVDTGSALQSFKERFELARLRVPFRTRPPALRWNAVLVEDKEQWPEPQVVCFAPSREYRFPVANPFEDDMDYLVKASEADPTVFTIYETLQRVLTYIASEDLQAAFAMAAAALDLLFDDAKHTSTGFTRAAELGALVLALESVRAVFTHFVGYLQQRTWVYGNRWLLAANVADGYRVTMSDGDWDRVSKLAEWDTLLSYRRAALVRERTQLARVLLQRRDHFGRELARAVRSRHDLAHRAQPLSDLNILALLIELLRGNLRLRVVSVDRGGFPSVMSQLTRAFAAMERGNAAPWDHGAVCASGVTADVGS
jgi:hypothetical protein